MKYRALDAAGDYQFGRSGLLLKDSPITVAQAIKTRLALTVGEWFVDLTTGTDYFGAILGHGTEGTRDLEVQSRILDTQGVLDIFNYYSTVKMTPFADRRLFAVVVEVETIYGAAKLNLEL